MVKTNSNTSAEKRVEIPKEERSFTYSGNASERISLRSFLKQQRIPKSVISLLRGTEGAVLVNGMTAQLNELLRGGENVTVRLPEEQASENIIPVDIPLSILYEDRDLLIVNKPAGLPVHSSMNEHERTLAGAAAMYFQKTGVASTFHCMNRLDKNTSGVTVLCKGRLSAAILGESIEAGEVKRVYAAIVKGIVPESGRIDAPIGRAPGSVIERIVDPEHGQIATTRFLRAGCFMFCGDDTVMISENEAEQMPGNERQAEEREIYSLVLLKLETGRTHQIRVHMKQIGHPLPGDFLYCPEFKRFSRQPLHSVKMTVPLPEDGSIMEAEAPLPEDMRCMLPEELYQKMREMLSEIKL